jgi:hypothetical protein
MLHCGTKMDSQRFRKKLLGDQLPSPPTKHENGLSISSEDLRLKSSLASRDITCPARHSPGKEYSEKESAERFHFRLFSDINVSENGYKSTKLETIPNKPWR